MRCSSATVSFSRPPCSLNRAATAGMAETCRVETVPCASRSGPVTSQPASVALRLADPPQVVVDLGQQHLSRQPAREHSRHSLDSAALSASPRRHSLVQRADYGAISAPQRRILRRRPHAAA
eukprot:scaffold5586_cov124-Isochrysis_galbana.AAC.9